MRLTSSTQFGWQQISLDLNSLGTKLDLRMVPSMICLMCEYEQNRLEGLEYDYYNSYGMVLSENSILFHFSHSILVAFPFSPSC